VTDSYYQNRLLQLSVYEASSVLTALALLFSVSIIGCGINLRMYLFFLVLVHAISTAVMYATSGFNTFHVIMAIVSVASTVVIHVCFLSYFTANHKSLDLATSPLIFYGFMLLLSILSAGISVFVYYTTNIQGADAEPSVRNRFAIVEYSMLFLLSTTNAVLFGHMALHKTSDYDKVPTGL